MVQRIHFGVRGLSALLHGFPFLLEVVVQRASGPETGVTAPGSEDGDDPRGRGRRRLRRTEPEMATTPDMTQASAQTSKTSISEIS